jgi:hypothetical protein
MSCNCESLHCSQPHVRECPDLRACPNPTQGHKVMYVGEVCPGCYRAMPEEYRLPYTGAPVNYYLDREGFKISF